MQIFEGGPFSGIKRLLANPMSLFVYAIMSKWYIMITLASLIVTFWVFKGLEEAGVLSAAQTVVSKALDDTKSVAKNCVPKIANLRAFWDCLNTPPKYEPTEAEQLLENQLNNDLEKKTPAKTHHDPYDDESSGN